jgi:uncharacterized protein with HEPN domain
MREELRDPGRLEHILMAINNVLVFMDGHSKEDLEKDKLLFYGVVKNVEIVGEASYMLTNDFKDKHHLTKWDQIIRMRHILVHGYYQIEVPELWNIVQNDLQPLRAQITEYLKEFNTKS